MILFRVHLSIYPCRDGIHTIFGNSMYDISKFESIVISTIIIPSAAALALFLPKIEYLIIGLGSLLNPIVRSKVGIFLHAVFVLLSEIQDTRVQEKENHVLCGNDCDAMYRYRFISIILV